MAHEQINPFYFSESSGHCFFGSLRMGLRNGDLHRRTHDHAGLAEVPFIQTLTARIGGEK
jgi:hypothetical protein